MNIQTALLPHKHVRFSDSIVALAGYTRSLLTDPKTVDELWAEISRDSSDWPSKPSFTNLVLALDTLFALNQVEQAPGGRVRRRDQ